MLLTNEKILKIRDIAKEQINLFGNKNKVDLDNVLDKYSISLRTFPEDAIKNVVSQMGIDCGEHPSGVFLQSISLDENKDHTILISSEQFTNHPNRTRFTVAHELGHYFLGHSPLSDQGVLFKPTLRAENFDYDENDELKELEANQFAAELLMPFEKVSQIIGIFSDEWSRSKVIELISETFDVSKKAAEIRYYRVMEEIHATK